MNLFAPFLLICTLFLLGGTLRAQTEAEITGQINDTSGAVVPGASITVTNVATGATRVVQSSDSGVYDVPALLPGNYSVSVKKNGFETIVRSGIDLHVQDVARVNFALKVGATTQSILVNANVTQMNTENATVGSVIGTQRIVGLPLNGRNLLQLTALEANVSYGFGENGTANSRVGGQRAAEDISVAGGRSEWNYFTLDGVSDTDVSYNTYTFLPSIDAVREFAIQTGVYPAEYGRGLDQVNISTISGTNALHGALFEFLRNSSTDAENYCFTSSCTASSLLHQNQFGLTVGGPVLIPKVFNGKDRLFFMANYEGFRFSQGQNFVANVPTVAERGGDFTGFNPIYDPATRVQEPNGDVTAQPFANNMIPQDRLDPIALKLLTYFPMPTNSGSVNNYSDVLSSTQTNNQFTVRIDYNQGSRSTWFGRYSFSNENAITPGSAIIQTGTRLITYPKQFVLSNTETISSRTLNQFWFGFNRLNNQILNWDSGNSAENVVGAIGGIPGVATPTPLIYGIPSLNPNGLDSVGDNCCIPFVLYHNTFQYRDVLSMIRGKHSIAFGAEIRRDQDTSEGNSFVRGNFTFDGTASKNPSLPAGTTGVSFADYLLGLPEEFDSALALAQAELRGTSQSYFVQDDWKVTPRLTVSAGLRYDYYAPWTEKHDHIVNILWPTPNSGDQPILVMPGSGNFYDNIPVPFTFTGLDAVRSNVLGKATYFNNKNGFQPRLGIVYSPTSKWVVRTGVGVYDVLDMQDINFDPSRTLAARRQIPTNASFPNLTFENPLGGNGTSFAVATPFSYAVKPHMHTPYVYQYLLDVQRQITTNLMIDVGYLGSSGHDLAALLDLNDPLTPGPGSVQSRRPYPGFGVIQTDWDYDNSNYNGLSVRLEKRLSQGLNLVESYTWGRSIDLSSSVRSHIGDTLFPQDPYDPAADRGPSNFNIDQRSATSVLYDLPFGKGREWMTRGGVANVVLGGWQLGGIITIQSGFPYDLNSGVDSANIGESGYERPNYTGAPVKVSNPGPHAWFNPAAFVQPPDYTYGNVGRNSILGPGLADADISLMKDFGVHENDYFQFRFETFNTFNHPNWGEPNITLNSPGFSSITSTNGNMRELQGGLKFYF